MQTVPVSRNALKARSWLSVVHAYQTCERQYQRLLASFDLTIAQFDVLSVIDELGEQAAPAQIAQRLLVTKGNITGIIRRLADRDLVRQLPNEQDGRSVLCAMTPAARALLADARSASSRFIDKQLSPFSDSQLAGAEQLMERMRRQLEQMDPEAIAASAPPSARRASVA